MSNQAIAQGRCLNFLHRCVAAWCKDRSRDWKGRIVDIAGTPHALVYSYPRSDVVMAKERPEWYQKWRAANRLNVMLSVADFAAAERASTVDLLREHLHLQFDRAVYDGPEEVGD